ncbi:ferredoxin [Mycobacteroides abscessus subsp. abscessus]|uniref:2Fe-2S iron-sulfur cluster-binding protein n=1 Tax=Rothia kristinae TaxID=37923 RepID=UPI00077431CF|nr:2Fe-2S iron-sulfur cluster-binding protein [Rothia kristinae]SIM86641.1 ferredoxin [Mycobacteroides abscessus subsp. abscessus]SQC37616.1 Ferredoxin VI [Rothia kristinae]
MSINITVVDEAGEARDVEWTENQTLLECLHKNQYPVLATCGGNASCATCHAFLDPQHYPAGGERTEEEEDLLEMIDDVATEYSRLSCQTEYHEGLDGATVTLKPGM